MLNLNQLLANDKLKPEYAAFFLEFAEIDSNPQSETFTHLNGGLDRLISGNRKRLDDLKIRSWFLDQATLTFIKLAYVRLILKQKDSPNLIHKIMVNDVAELFDLNINDAAERLIDQLKLGQKFEEFILEDNFKK